MAVSGGQIEYIVSAETSSLLTGERNANQFVKTISEGMQAADRSVSNFNKTSKTVSGNIDNAEKSVERFVSSVESGISSAENHVLDFNKSAVITSKEIEKAEISSEKLSRTVSSGMQKSIESVSGFNKSISSTNKGVDSVSESSKSASSSVSKLSYSTKSANDDLGKFGRKAGQAGIQFQQLVGQIQGGQNVFNAVSAQAADLGFVLGFPLLGAVTGIATAVAGPLIASLIGVDGESKKLAGDMETLNKIIERNKNGVNALSNEYAILAKATAAVAEADLAIAMTEATQALRNSQSAVTDSLNSLSSWTDNVDDAVDAIGMLERKGLKGFDLLREIEKLSFTSQLSDFNDLNGIIETLSGSIGASKLQAVELVSAIRATKVNPTVDSFDRLLKITAEISKQTKYANKDFNEFAKSVVEAAKSGRLSAEAIGILTGAIGGANTATSQALETFQSLKDELKFQASLVGKSANQIEVLTAQQRLGKDATEQQKSAIAGLVTELQNLKAASEFRGTGPSPIFDFTAGMPSKADLNKRLSDLDSALQTQSERSKARMEQQRSDAELLYSQGLMSETEFNDARRRISDEYYKSIDMQGKNSVASYNEYLNQKKDADAEYARQYLETTSTLSKVALTATEALASGAVTAFNEIASGTSSAEDAMKGLARTIINSVLQSLIQTAIQYTVLPALANAFGLAQAQASATAAGASIAASQATAASTSVAAAEVATASAPAAAATATWSFGSAALIGAAALGSIFLLSKTLSGNRRYGGSVSSGNMYQVNESGIPEVYSYGNSDYLMASNNAKVTPLDKFASGGEMNISINNYASDSVSVSAQKTENGYDIDIVSKQVASNLSSQLNRRQGSFYQSVKGVR